MLQHSPAIIAGILYRDGARDRDDSTILVARLNGEQANA
jgi:hypothetical protein